jgi:hypothetical protein
MILFSHLTWTDYLEFITAGLLIYYSYVLISCYRSELTAVTARLWAGKQTGNADSFLIPGQSPDEDANPSAVTHNGQPPDDAGLLRAEGAVAAVRALVQQNQAAANPPAEVVPKIKALLNDLKIPVLLPYRDLINHAIVTVFKQYNLALLTEDEVDDWW